MHPLRGCHPAGVRFIRAVGGLGGRKNRRPFARASRRSSAGSDKSPALANSLVPLQGFALSCPV
jgi:hypothetical protein